jgi:hypothetical protein
MTEFGVLEAASARVVEVKRGRMREALHEDAGGQGVRVGADLAFDGGRIGAFAFAVEVAVVPVEIAFSASEDEQSAAFFDEAVDVGHGLALKALDVGHDDDFLLAEVVLAEFAQIDLLGTDEVLERRRGSRRVRREGDVEEVGGTTQRILARIAVEEYDIELVTHLHDGVEGIVVGEAVAFEADGEGMVADFVERVSEGQNGLALGRE